MAPAQVLTLPLTLTSHIPISARTTTMGNDGGSIPDRRDLVKTRPKVCLSPYSHIHLLTWFSKAEQADKANQTRAKWFFCALSKVSI